MAVTNTAYNLFKGKAYDNSTKIQLAVDTFKCMILDNGYTIDIDAHEFIDDVSGDEVSGAAYTAGGREVTTKAWALDAGNDRFEWDFDNITWPAVTFTNGRYGVLYKDTGTPGTSPLICCIDFDADKSPAGDDFTIAIGADGILHAG